VIVVRASKTIALPPSLLGFHEFIKPDEYDPAKPKFKGNFHYTPPAITDLQAQVKSACNEALFEKLKAEFYESNPKTAKLKDPMDVEEWLESKLKPAKEDPKTDWQALPFIQLSMPATYKDRSGEVQPKEVACWDGKNRKLNLKKLRMSRGSTVQAIVAPSLFYSKALAGLVQPTFKLVGVRVLKLITWSGSGAAAPEADEEEIRNVLGADFEADDLSMYMGEEDPDPVLPEADDAGAVEKMF
jgi:hypothetical protein